MSNFPSVSVIIRTRNRLQKLKNCISSVLNIDYPDLNIVCVIDAATDGTREYLEATYKENKKFTVVYNPKHISSAYLYNLGIKHATGDIVVFIDDDAIADRNCVKELVGSFMADKKVECVGGVSYLPQSDEIQWPGRLAGCILAFRKSLFDRFSFDENLKYSHFYDETELFVRLRAKGKRLLLNKKAFVIHHCDLQEQKEKVALEPLNHIYSRVKTCSLREYYFSLLYYLFCGAYSRKIGLLYFLTKHLSALGVSRFSMLLKIKVIYSLILEIPIKARIRRWKEDKEEQRKVIPQLIVVTGVRRSGNHAVINWICKGLSGETLFLNDCVVQPKRIWPTYWAVYKGLNWFAGGISGAPEMADNPEPVFHMKKLNEALERRFSEAVNLVISFENVGIRYFENDRVLKTDPVRRFLKERPGCAIKFVIINRDPFNMLASYFKSQAQEDFKRIVHFWKRNVKAFRRPKGAFFCDPIGVVFNNWVCSRRYRDSLSKRLGFQNKDKGLLDVPKYWLSSSFDGVTYDGKADKMDVYSRWKGFIENKEYLNLVKDKELQDLSQKYCNFKTPTEILEKLR